MEVLIIIAILCFVIYLVGTRRNTLSEPSSFQINSPTPYSPSRAGPRSNKVVFKGLRGENPRRIDISGLHDAFTGEQLDLSQGLYQCQPCTVFYHLSSLEVIRAENQGRCVACNDRNIKEVVEGQGSRRGRDYEAEVITIETYRQYIGRVITFEGIVPRINVSRDGRSYAVMFEDTSWANGLKLCVFKGHVRAVGGSAFLKGLKGRRLKVRGLLTLHPQFGHQIIVTQRSMILDVQ